MVSFAELLVVLLLLAVGAVLGAVVGVLWARSRPVLGVDAEGDLTDDPALELARVEHHAAIERAQDRALVSDGLERLASQLQQLEHNRVAWQGEFAAQVKHVQAGTEHLRRETQALGDALRKPQVRGRWGEMHLRRAVELAGLVNRCDFTEQTQLDGGRLRPDLVVHLAGGRSVVVDAKVPLDAYADAARSDDAETTENHLVRHAKQVRTHIDQLGAKSYWQHLNSPEFVVLFLPAEPFLSAALDVTPDLVEHAASRNVVIATPTTLIALLRTVAHGWAHEALTEQAAQVQRIGQELHARLGTLGTHVDTVGKSLNKAVEAYNKAVGSLETRVFVTARKFTDLGVATAELPTPQIVDQRSRNVSAPEWEATPTDLLSVLDEVDTDEADEFDDRRRRELLDPGAARHPRPSRDAS